MGIVNVTADSFSDGGQFLDSRVAIEHGLRLAADGAQLVDVGGESTRPGAEPVSLDEELERVMPVVEALVREGVAVSVDTMKPEVMSAAARAGCAMVNDVNGFRAPGAVEAVAASEVAVCAMHMQGTPRTMQLDPRYDDVVTEIHAYLEARRDALLAAGIAAERICLDPGIGFGKTHAHNLALLRQAGRFLDLGTPILVGHSRKGFLAKAVEPSLGRAASEADRDAATAGAACGLAAQGIQIVRVHAVGLVRAALELFTAAV